MLIRKDLRDVQYQLRKEIERLGSLKKALSIGLVPLLVSAGARTGRLLRRSTGIRRYRANRRDNRR